MNRTYREKLNDYFESRFSVGIESYMRSLQKHGIVGKRNILDVGCGPGEWAFAAAKLNPDASVIGIDINDIALDFAIKKMKENEIANCEFLKESYENLLKIFQSESFDVIMCNSVIQYIDEKKAFQIFSHLLKKGGILIMFWNHGPGYYLWKIFSGIKNLNFGTIIYGVNTIINTLSTLSLNPNPRDHFVTLRQLRRISKGVGIALTQIETEPRLDYRDRYFGIPYVFSCKGIKI